MATTAFATVTPVAQEHRREHAVSARWIAVTRTIMGNRFIVQLGNGKEIRIIGI